MPDASPDTFDECVKIAVIGPQGSGKTSLVHRCTTSWFCESEPTFGVDFRLCTIPVDGRQTRLHLWDTTGSARFAKITHAYYRIAQGILLVYDATDADALGRVGTWLEQVSTYASDSVCVLLCGTKADRLSKEERARVLIHGNTTAARAGIAHVLTSAKDNEGVLPAFEALTREVRAAAAQRSRAVVLRNETFGERMIKHCYSPAVCPGLSCCMPLWHQPICESPTSVHRRAEAAM